MDFFFFFFFNLLRQSQHFRNFQETPEELCCPRVTSSLACPLALQGILPGCVWEAAPCHNVPMASSDHRPQIWGLGREGKGSRGGQELGNPAVEGNSNLLWWPHLGLLGSSLQEKSERSHTREWLCPQIPGVGYLGAEMGLRECWPDPGLE